MVYILLLCLSFVWGITYTIVKLSIIDIPFEIFQLWRYFIATVFIFMIFHKKILSTNKKLLKEGIFTVGLSAFFASFVSILAIKMESASQTAFICSVPVIILPFLLYFHNKKKPIRMEILSLTLCVIGILFMTTPWKNTFGMGDAFLFLSSLFYAYQYLFIDQFVRKTSIEVTVFTQVLTVTIGFILIVVYRILTNDFHFIDIVALPSFSWTVLLFIGIIVTAMGWFLEGYCQKKVTPLIVATILTLEPLFTAISEKVLLGFELSKMQGIGGCIIFISTILLACGYYKTKRSENKSL